MGACCPADPYTPDDDPQSGKATYKILFLGSGGCGKSTFFKQLRKLYGEGFNNKHRIEAVGTIATFVVEVMQSLLLEDHRKKEDYEDDEKGDYEEKEDGDQKLNFEDEKAAAAAEQILKVQAGRNPVILDGEIATNIKILWAQPAVQSRFNASVKCEYAWCHKYKL